MWSATQHRRNKCKYNYISTHALTWSATVTIAATKNPIRQISTHALTWSATDGVIDETRIDGISTHALTWSATGPADEAGRGGPISTHALTWSATVQHASPIIIGNIISTHALTWSATEAGAATSTATENFNSRAHVERDPTTYR